MEEALGFVKSNHSKYYFDWNAGERREVMEISDCF